MEERIVRRKKKTVVTVVTLVDSEGIHRMVPVEADSMDFSTIEKAVRKLESEPMYTFSKCSTVSRRPMKKEYQSEATKARLRANAEALFTI